MQQRLELFVWIELAVSGPRRARGLPVLPGERAAVRPDHVAGSREIVPLVGVRFSMFGAGLSLFLACSRDMVYSE